MENKVCLGSWALENRSVSCSGHGYCHYVNIIDRSMLNKCKISNTGCEAQCVCMAGYGGNDCSRTSSQVNDVLYMRSRVCDAIRNLTAIQDVSSQLLLAVSAVLQKFLDGSELDVDGAEKCALDVEKMALYAAAGYLDSADIAQQLIMDSLSSLVKLSQEFQSLNLPILSIISLLIEGVQRGMVQGQFSSSIISNYVRTSVRYDTSSYFHAVTLQPPASAEDMVYSVPTPSIKMPLDGLDACGISGHYIQISLTQWVANPYPQQNSTDFKSSLLRYSSSTTSTPLSLSAATSTTRNSSFDVSLFFNTMQNWTSKVPGCHLLTNSQNAPCKCKLLRYSPYNVTFKCWDMNMLCPIILNSTTIAGIRRDNDRRLDFDFQGSETSSASYTDTTKSEEIGALIMALGKEVPATLIRTPSLEEALPAFCLVGGLMCLFIVGLYSLWTWDVLDKQLIIYASSCGHNKPGNKVKGGERTKNALIGRYSSDSMLSAKSLEKFSIQSSKNTSLQLHSPTLREKCDLNLIFYNIGLLDFTYGNNMNEATHSVTNQTANDSENNIIRACERNNSSADMSPKLSEDSSVVEANFLNNIYNTSIPLESGGIISEENKDEGINVCKRENVNEIESHCSSGMAASDPIDALSINNKNFRYLVPEFIADHLTHGLLQTRGIVRRYLMVLLRDHDWIRIFTYKSRRMTRTIRFTIVFADLLVLLFIDSLFYGVLFPSNSSTCANYSTASGGTRDECLNQHSLWQGRDLCLWNYDDQTCEFNPPPTNFEFFVVIAMLVSIFSIPFQATTRYL